MKRLLHQFMLPAVLFVALPAPARGAAAQDEAWIERQAERVERAAERQAERVERAAERAAEHAERAGERLEEGAERLQDRIERRIDRIERNGGAHIVVGKGYTLPEGAVARDGIVVLGGNATIDGTAEHDVVVIGGRLRIGPKAVIHGDVATFGGTLDRDARARIDGDVDVARVRLPNWDWNWDRGFPQLGTIWWEGAALAFTVGRFAFVLFLSILLVLIAPKWTGSIGSRLGRAPVVSGIAGLTAEILFAPALVCLTIALIITVVGIPLLAGLPFLVAGFALLWVAGYTAVAGVLGARLRRSDPYARGWGAGDVIVGSLALSGLTLFGQLLMMSSDGLAPLGMAMRAGGWAVEYMAWTAGLGAALTAWRQRSSGFDPRAVPPVLPPLPTRSATAI